MSPSRLREAMQRIGPILCQFYGQSEAPMTVTVLRKHEHVIDDCDRLRSCGRPAPQLHFALLDDNSEPVPDGTPGEICVAGPLVMQGYWRQPELTAAAIHDGWLHTGDVAVRDEQGFITLVDRKKDMIITGGFNVYPREVENVLSSHPAVQDCAVVGAPHERWGEAVNAFVVLRKGAACSAEDLIALVRVRKGAVQAPKRIHFVDSIPLTAVGKPDKKAIRQQLSEKAGAHG
jgi:fatty-acyl-CoA synthase